MCFLFFIVVLLFFFQDQDVKIDTCGGYSASVTYKASVWRDQSVNTCSKFGLRNHSGA